jgi:hypothetical protein
MNNALGWLVAVCAVASVCGCQTLDGRHANGRGGPAVSHRTPLFSPQYASGPRGYPPPAQVPRVLAPVQVTSVPAPDMRRHFSVRPVSAHGRPQLVDMSDAAASAVLSPAAGGASPQIVHSGPGGGAVELSPSGLHSPQGAGNPVCVDSATAAGTGTTAWPAATGSWPALAGGDGCPDGAGHPGMLRARLAGLHGQMHQHCQGLPCGPTEGTVTYPYYTVRGPRDFLMANPPSIGR